MHDRDLRHAGRRQPRLVAEAAPALDEHLRLVEQIGAAGFDQLHHRQFVLRAICWMRRFFFDAHRRRGAAFDGAVVGGDHAANAGHIADAGDAAAALDAFGAVVVVHAKAGERREFEPGRAGIDQQRYPLARQQLFARAEAITPCVRRVPDLLLQRAEFADKREHLLAI